MMRRFLSACVGVLFLGALTIPAHLTAKPPDVPKSKAGQIQEWKPQIFISGLTPVKTDDEKEPGVELMVTGLMKACYLLMDQGLYHHAAELARQAYALDPERVLADPLIYKMHLLTETPLPTGAHEESEPQTCPYYPAIVKPIDGIVPQKKKSEAEDTAVPSPQPPIDYDFEVNADASRGLRLCAECSVGASIYHLRFQRGCLAIWKTVDAGKLKP